MAKKLIKKYVFEPGISKDDNLLPNAVALLTANKAFLQAQVVAFINDRIANNVAPFVDYTYASQKCTRDVGFFIDAIIHDLRYGGNVECRKIADYFWINGEPQIRGDVSPEIAGQAYLRDIINSFIFTNTTVTPSYGQGAVLQTKFTGQDAETGAASRNTTLWSVFSTVIQNGIPSMPAKQTGVSQIKLLGKYTASEVLLITNTNTGQILYNFADSNNSIAISYKNGRSSGDGNLISDLDFPSWWQYDDTITTLKLSEDTSSLFSTTDLQIFVEEPYQTIRPWEFGTDAIERMRVAMPQAMLDADFEYGLQPTKWQALGLIRSYPSLYEIPGTDLSVSAVTTDASTNTGGFGSSLITVTTTGSHGFSQGQAITVKGLNPAINGFSRAEGSFLVATIPSSTSFTYYSSSKVGVTNGENLYTSFVQVRQAGFYTGSSIGQPNFTVFSNGSTLNITSKFDTPSGSFQLAFNGTAPTPGSPISGSPLIPAGTSVSGVTGAGTSIVSVLETTEATDTSIQLVDLTGVQQGMAIDNGSGEAVFVNSITGNLLTLSDQIGQIYVGANAVNTGISGTNINGIGTGATFTVSRSAGLYTVVDAGDSTWNGSNYAVGDRLVIAGNLLGGATPANDVTISVNTIDSGGAIETFGVTGTAISGGATYTNINQSSTTGLGALATIDVVREGGTGAYTITLNSGGGGYQPGDTITWLGSLFDGVDGINDIVMQVNGVAFGTDAIVDYEILGSPVGVTGNAEYTSLTASNVPVIGAGAVFTVTRIDGVYTAVATTGGSDYVVGNRITLSGTDLDGASTLNDCILTVTGTSSGSITTVTADGTPFEGDTISIYPTMTLSEPITGIILDNVVLNVGAIATVQVDFSSAHGLIPGTTILTNITSTPAPDFASTQRTLPSPGTWTGTSFAGTTFVAVRSGSTATARSVDGQTWTAGGLLPSAANWTATAAGAIGSVNYWVAVATGSNAAAYSIDGGQNWIAATLPSSSNWSAVTYSNGSFIAVASGGTAAAYSTNGTSWTASTLPASATWSDVTGGLIGSSVYVIAVASGGTAAAYSADGGAGWTNMSALPSSTTWSTVVYGNSRFLAVARGTTNAAISTNGTSWTAVTLPTSANWNCSAFGNDTFVIIADGSTSALTSFTGETGSWTDRVLAASATWEEIAYGDYGGTDIFAVIASGAAQALSVNLTRANHSLAAGPFVITSVPSPTSLRYPARTTGTINTSNAGLTGILYVRPDSFFTHRPFDGGVQLGTGGPTHGAQAVRQSKKYIRYQSGKGIMYTTGGLFAPSYNISSATAQDTVLNSIITFTCDDTDHGLQPGAVIEIIGCNSFEYNGEYTVESILDARRFRVRSQVVLSTTSASLGTEAKVILKRWHGATVRIGAFDDQNGIFYQYNGTELSVVRRSSTNQLTGTVSLATESNLVTGAGSRFQDQLTVGSKIVIRGMSHTVTSIASQTSMTISPDWRGANSITGAKICITQDFVVPQSEWNIDQVDGTGPSGYDILPWRMQMLGIQYSWYAVGFIEFMIRGGDGRFIFLHKMRHSNVTTEAYMRTANLPVRYEVENKSAESKLSEAMTAGSNSLKITDGYNFPSSGIVYIDNEMISYSGKNGNTLQNLTRAASMTNFAAGQNRTFTAGIAASHAVGAGVILVSCTCTPTISHWGSALLTDGRFDEDRGYLFNYAATGLSASTNKQTAFMIRLAPSVSNALTGDLGERDLLNRAQLLLNQIAITADTGTGAIVVEGVLNPRNYPSNPSNILWNGLSSSGVGGQPSFAQIALGGSVNWGGTPITTSTATISGAVTANFTAIGTNTDNTTYRNAFRNDRSTFILTTAAFDTSGIQIGDIITNATFLVGGRSISNIQRNGISIGGVPHTIIFMNANASATSGNNTNVTITIQIPQTAASYASTNYLFFTNASWNASGAAVGTRVAPAFTQFPAGTSASAVATRTLAGQIVRRVTFTQNSNATLNAAGTVTFEFGDPQYALPGEQVFAFVSNPGNTTSIDLDQLKELTTTAIGGRGTFPNGPDVLAINIIKVSGTATPCSVVLRWGEAQA